jgi:serine/threonine-protein kinase
MGAWQSGAPFRDEERPGHPFTLSSYYIQQTEVTYGEFSRFLQDSSITKTDARLQYYFQVLKELDETLNDKAVRDKRPAVCVSWELAKLYATYAGGDLPSEAQWEFAARSRGKKQYYVWGDDPKGLEKRSNWAWVNRTNGTDTTYTLDVNNPLKDETAQHVYHMMGNVREWCRDVWHRFPLDPNVQLPVDHVEGTSAGETNPKYVIRGASFDTQLPEEMARLTYRASAGECYYSAESDKSFPDVGFRLVLDIVIPESTPGGAGGQP